MEVEADERLCEEINMLPVVTRTENDVRGRITERSKLDGALDFSG